jgi:hypothetical protein
MSGVASGVSRRVRPPRYPPGMPDRPYRAHGTCGNSDSALRPLGLYGREIGCDECGRKYPAPPAKNWGTSWSNLIEISQADEVPDVPRW